MKRGIFGDLHLGCRGNSFHMRKFIQDYIIKKILAFVAMDIRDIDILGDIGHSRTFIHMQDIYFLRVTLKELCEEHGIRLTVIVGNHDSHFKNTTHINGPEMLMADYATIISKPISNKPGCIDMLPWINPENENEANNIMKNASDYCYGHLELIGFQFSENVYSKDGMDASLLKQYKRVLTGHYHVKQSVGNVDYLGTPYAISWTEYNTPKGVHVFDTDTNALEFIENEPNEGIFMMVDFEIEPKFEIEDLVGKIVKCNIIEKSTPMKMKKFFEKMAEVDVVNLVYIDHTETEKEDVDVVELDEAGSNINDTIVAWGKENEIDNNVVNYGIDVVKRVEESV